MRLALALLLFVAGCAGDTLRGSGVAVMPPQGYTLYCINNPTAKECGG